VALLLVAFLVAFFFLAAGRRRVTFARVRPRAFLAFPRFAARFLFATLCPSSMI